MPTSTGICSNIYMAIAVVEHVPMEVGNYSSAVLALPPVARRAKLTDCWHGCPGMAAVAAAERPRTEAALGLGRTRVVLYSRSFALYRSH